MLKSFFLNLVEKTIDILVVLSIIVIFIAAAAAVEQARTFGEGLIGFVVIFLVGLIYLAFVVYILYWLIDVRQVLHKIKEELEKLNQTRT